MSDSKIYEELSILEDELIDHYVRGNMTPADRARFESYFLQSTQNHQKMRFARALTKYVDATDQERMLSAPTVDHTSLTPHEDRSSRSSTKPRSFHFWPFQKPTYRYAFAAVLLVLIAALSWLTIRSLWSAGEGRVFEATLIPGEVLREGGAIQTISIPQGTDTLRLELIVSDDHFQDYQVNVLASDGSSVWLRDHLISGDNAGKKSLRVGISARVLKPDIYRIKLSGGSSGSYEEIATYTFRINR